MLTLSHADQGTCHHAIEIAISQEYCTNHRRSKLHETRRLGTLQKLLQVAADEP